MKNPTTGISKPILVCLALAALTLILTLFAGITAQAHTTHNPSNYIGVDEAKSAVLTHAGLSESSVSKLDVDLDNHGGVAMYEVELRHNGTEYEYEIDAVSGEIIWSSKDGASAMQYIGADEAKSIAFFHAGVSSTAVRKLETKLDRDDGRSIYEVEFVSGGMEYEYDIDAVSGDILCWESEWD